MVPYRYLRLLYRFRFVIALYVAAETAFKIGKFANKHRPHHH